MKDRSHSGASLMTAYDSNTRYKSTRSVDSQNYGWHPVINRLLDLEHSFLGYTYTDDGFLFRGMSSGLLDALSQDRFTGYEDSKPHACLEAELAVYFVSHDLSDAITTSRIWEVVDDACILVIPASLFNQRYEQKQAAMMAFAEPGVVFKYPLFVEPLMLSELCYIIVNSRTDRKLRSKLTANQRNVLNEKRLVIEPPADKTNLRQAYEEMIISSFNSLGVNKAEPVAVTSFPSKK